MSKETLQQTPKNFKIFRKYFKNLYSMKLKNLKEMDGFLNSAKLPKLSQQPKAFQVKNRKAGTR